MLNLNTIRSLQNLAASHYQTNVLYQVLTWALAAIKSIFNLLASQGDGGGIDLFELSESVRLRLPGVDKSFPMLDFRLAPAKILLIPWDKITF